MLDDCNFHQSVSLDKFEAERLLKLTPPDGELAVMNYRSTYPFKPPFRVSTIVEDDPNTALKVRLLAGLLLPSFWQATKLDISLPPSLWFTYMLQVPNLQACGRSSSTEVLIGQKTCPEGISSASAGNYHRPDQPGLWIGQSS